MTSVVHVDILFFVEQEVHVQTLRLQLVMYTFCVFFGSCTNPMTFSCSCKHFDYFCTTGGGGHVQTL